MSNKTKHIAAALFLGLILGSQTVGAVIVDAPDPDSSVTNDLVTSTDLNQIGNVSTILCSGLDAASLESCDNEMEESAFQQNLTPASSYTPPENPGDNSDPDPTPAPPPTIIYVNVPGPTTYIPVPTSVLNQASSGGSTTTSSGTLSSTTGTHANTTTATTGSSAPQSSQTISQQGNTLRSSQSEEGPVIDSGKVNFTPDQTTPDQTPLASTTIPATSDNSSPASTTTSNTETTPPTVTTPAPSVTAPSAAPSTESTIPAPIAQDLEVIDANIQDLQNQINEATRIDFMGALDTNSDTLTSATASPQTAGIEAILLLTVVFILQSTIFGFASAKKLKNKMGLLKLQKAVAGTRKQNKK